MSLEERSKSCGDITGSKGVGFAKRIQLIFDAMSRSPYSPAGSGNARLSWFAITALERRRRSETSGTMAVLLETTLGDIVIDLFTDERPKCKKLFFKLQKDHL